MPAASPVETGLVLLEGNQAYVYPGVPPVTVALAVPSELPLHAAGVEVVVKARADGWLTVALCVTVQPLASVIVT